MNLETVIVGGLFTLAGSAITVLLSYLGKARETTVNAEKELRDDLMAELSNLRTRVITLEVENAKLREEKLELRARLEAVTLRASLNLPPKEGEA